MKTIKTPPKGSIAPVSSTTAHSVMCLHLERIILLGRLATASYRPTGQYSRSPLVASTWRRHLMNVLIAVFGLICLGALSMEAQSTFGSIRGTVQDASGAAIPDAQV